MFLRPKIDCTVSEKKNPPSPLSLRRRRSFFLLRFPRSLLFQLCAVFFLFFGLQVLEKIPFAPRLYSQTEIRNESFSEKSAESKPLLRVFPSFRKEECDWAIRWDVCLQCLKSGRRYAQKIHFFASGPYREHGCYSDEEGFFLMED
nr:hypothetical protein [Leptospira gomenensis]